MSDRTWKLSVLITTYNESDQIEDTLKSVLWADEIVVVDSFSTDNTPEIVKKYPVRLLQRAYSGPADQKNWGLEQVTFDWTLILDADEVVPPELTAEIQGILSKGTSSDAFRIPRLNHFMNQPIRYSGWQNDSVIRLVRKDKCRYNDLQVHEEIDTDNIQVGKLKKQLIHYTFKNARHYLDKLIRYSEWSAQDKSAGKSGKVTLFHLALKPLVRFIKHYFLQMGFLDGKTGFVVCSLMAWSVFLRYYFMLNRNQKSDR